MWQNAKDGRLIKEQGRSARMRQAGLMCGFAHMNTLSGAAGTAYLQVNCVRGLGHVCTCRRDVRSALSTRFAGRRTGSRGMGNKRETLNRLKDVASEGHLCAFVCASVAPSLGGSVRRHYAEVQEVDLCVRPRITRLRRRSQLSSSNSTP